MLGGVKTGADIVRLLGVRRHVLDYAGFAALDLIDAVVVICSAGIDILGLVDGRRQVRLSRLFGEIGAGNLYLKTRFVRSGRYYVKVL